MVSLPGALSGARLAPSESRGAPLPVPSSSTSGGLKGHRLQATDALRRLPAWGAGGPCHALRANRFDGFCL